MRESCNEDKMRTPRVYWLLFMKDHLCRQSAVARNGGPESITTGLNVVHYVYLLASRKHGTRYAGVTGDLLGRAYQHKFDIVPGFRGAC
jgi:hypothetical protein